MGICPFERRQIETISLRFEGGTVTTGRSVSKRRIKPLADNLMAHIELQPVTRTDSEEPPQDDDSEQRVLPYSVPRPTILILLTTYPLVIHCMYRRSNSKLKR